MPVRFPMPAARAGVAICLPLAAKSACAHSAARGAGDFYAGALHALTGLIVTDYLLHRKAGWIHIAVRVAGSWIAAIGILVLATSGVAILKA